MAERKKKQAAVFAKDESTFVNGSSAKGANTTHKGKEKCSGTNQPRDENRTSGHDVQKSELEEMQDMDRVTSSPGIRIQVIIRKVIFHRKIMLLLRRMFLGRRKASHRMITTAGILTTNPKKRGNIAGGNIRTGRETGLLILSMTFRQRTALLRRVKGQSLKEAKS